MLYAMHMFRVYITRSHVSHCAHAIFVLLSRRTHLLPFGLKMAASRAKCEITQDVVEMALKKHVSDIDSGLWKDDNPEEVVRAYLVFFCALAKQTPRVTPAVIQKAAKAQFSVNDVVAKSFGQAVSNCLAYCYHKGQKAVSGKK